MIRSRLAAGAVVSTALILAVCTSATTASSASTTKSPIPVGAVVQTSSPTTGSVVHTVTETIDAWSTYANAHGGLNGHPVKVYIEDDTKSSAATETSDVHKLIQTDHVVALLDATDLSATWQTIAVSAKVPVISLTESASSTVHEQYLKLPDFFANGTTVTAILYGHLAMAKAAGGTVFGGIYCTNTPACASAVTVWKYDAQIIPGIKYGVSVGATYSAPTFTAQCVAEKQAGVNALFPIVRATTTANNCAAQGYHPIYIGSQGTISFTMAKDPNLNGAVQNEQGFPWMLDTTPAQKLFHKIEGQTLAKALTPPSVTASYTGLVLLQKALSNAPTGTVSTSDVLNGLYSIHNTNLGGLSATPLTFTKTKVHYENCYFIVTIKNKKWAAFDNGKPQCMPVKDEGKL